MNANTVRNHAGEEEVDSNNVLQTRSGRQYVRFSAVVQAQFDHDSTVSDISAEPTSKNISPFLLLPGELRNLVYEYPCIWRAPGMRFTTWHPSRPFRSLRQPPITRVNRQLRDETLGLFYSKQDFRLQTSFSPFGFPNINAEAVVPFHSASKMLNAFTPKPQSALWVSSLMFLSRLTVDVEIDHGWLESLSFIMSSENFAVYEKEVEFMHTDGLKWNNKEEVSNAICQAVVSCELFEPIAATDGAQNFRNTAEETADDAARIVCLVARHCPQLTSFVAVTITPIKWGQLLLGWHWY